MTGWIEPPPRNGAARDASAKAADSLLLVVVLNDRRWGRDLPRDEEAFPPLSTPPFGLERRTCSQTNSSVPQFETTQENIAVTKRKWADFRNATPNNTVVENTATVDVPRDAAQARLN